MLHKQFTPDQVTGQPQGAEAALQRAQQSVAVIRDRARQYREAKEKLLNPPEVVQQKQGWI